MNTETQMNPCSKVLVSTLLFQDFPHGPSHINSSIKKAVTATHATTHSQSSYHTLRFFNRRAMNRSMTAIVARMYVIKAAEYSDGRWLWERKAGDRFGCDSVVAMIGRLRIG